MTTAASGALLWRAFLDPEGAPPADRDRAAAAEAARRLGDLVTPALAQFMLRAVETQDGFAPLDDATVRQSLLMNRFTGEVQRRWTAAIVQAGLPVVVMKGFVFAHTLYPDPDIRTIGDLDILVRAADRDRLLAFLQDNGFAFEALPSSPWGFISDASYQPMVSADGACNIDVHVQPDCYPAYRSLTAERLFAAAGTAEIGGVALSVPSPAHALVLCLTNAAKDKFGPYSVRKLVDIAVLLRSGPKADWDEVRALARDGHFAAPARVAFALLARLGLPPELVPADLCAPPAGLRAPVFARLVADWQAMFANGPGGLGVLAREIALCTEPDVALHNALLRLRGLVAPRRGVPAGYRVRS